MLPSTGPPRPALGDLAPHGTTIVAATFPGGVVVAGDRRATMGNMIAQRDIEKVFPADEFSIIGIAGAAGLAVEMVGLFQVELEHYEKIEGAPLSLVGKANRLATMIRQNLALALQGLVVVPLFAGWDVATEEGRIFSYDATGGRYEEHAFFSVGSGSVFARGSLKKLYRPDLERRRSHHGGHPGPLRRLRRRLRDRWPGSDPADLPGRDGRHRRRRAAGGRRPDRHHGQSDDGEPDGTARRTGSSPDVRTES